MQIVVLPGDGIGPEITAATSGVLRAASERFQLNLRLEEHAVGHASLKQFGTTVRPELLDVVRAADGLILGPTATFDFKDEAHGEINPSRHFRKNLADADNSGDARCIVISTIVYPVAIFIRFADAKMIPVSAEHDRFVL